ncbi:protein-disulfide reductase DsbD domain-containing protein [Roseibium sp. RKSG952]|uniref:protein-disulfide reductase DsbD domain-containing protein n=1 Tax=Roseibium sp. RKSG952 TaxID=2529384 RepID=UPI0012BB8D5E|nr:protein-disulfide reductase DsbD domain-containing protein [Roseibium sp. RKSG952]MTI00580.1 hypothetical protein [Roseibium sp. RKSG952]
MKKKILRALTIGFLMMPVPALALTTDWVEVKGGAVRLIIDGEREGTAYRGGVEFMLEPGWHTYWRFPGEAGIPPQFDWDGSANLADIDIRYPVPERYDDGFSTSIVYHDGIVLPFFAEPEDPGKPLDLDLNLFFGVCNEICVPGDARFAVTLKPELEKDSLARRLIERDLENVPQAASQTASWQFEVTRNSASDKPSLSISANIPDDSHAVELFAAGPEGSYIGVPKLGSHVNGVAIWELSSSGLLSGPNGKTYLDLVLIQDGRGTETRIDLPDDSLK